MKSNLNKFKGIGKTGFTQKIIIRFLKFVFIYRNCGKVYCNECTNYTLPVPQQQLNSPVRVCKQCYGAMLEHRDELTLLNGDIKGEVTPQAEDIEAAMMDDASDPHVKSPVATTTTSTTIGTD